MGSHTSPAMWQENMHVYIQIYFQSSLMHEKMRIVSGAIKKVYW